MWLKFGVRTGMSVSPSYDPNPWALISAGNKGNLKKSDMENCMKDIGNISKKTCIRVKNNSRQIIENIFYY